MGRVTGESGMRVVVIGGTGHVGTYLVPHLVAGGMRSSCSAVANGGRTSPMRPGRGCGCVAHLRYVPWEEWRAGVSATVAQATWDHIAHSPNCSMAKARRLLGFQPRYASLQAIRSRRSMRPWAG